MSPISTMTAKAAGLQAPACYCSENHTDAVHFYIESIVSVDSDDIVTYNIYQLDGENVTRFLSIADFISEFHVSPSVGDWFYNYDDTDVSLIIRCTGTHAAPSASPSEDKHESGSNDDDSRPAPPTPHQSAQASILSSVDTQLAAIASTNGQVKVDGKDLVNSLPNATMKKIAENPNAIVYFTYTYNDAKYTTAISGKDVDTSIEWYGPMYLMTHYPTIWLQDANTSVPVVAPVQ